MFYTSAQMIKVIAIIEIPMIEVKYKTTFFDFYTLSHDFCGAFVINDNKPNLITRAFFLREANDKFPLR